MPAAVKNKIVNKPANAQKIVMPPFLAVQELSSAGMSWLALENHLRHGLFRRMSNADRNILHAQSICDFPRLALQLQGRPSTPQSQHFNIDPADTTAPASSQRFHRRFLYSKTPCVSLVLILELLAIRALFFRKNALQKPFALSLHRALYPLHFFHVDSHPDYHAAPINARRAKCWI